MSGGQQCTQCKQLKAINRAWANNRTADIIIFSYVSVSAHLSQTCNEKTQKRVWLHDAEVYFSRASLCLSECVGHMTVRSAQDPHDFGL